MATCRNPQLLDLPDELLGAVLRQLSDTKSKQHVFKTCKRLATALLQHESTIRLTFPLSVSDSRSASGSSQSGSSDEDQHGIAPFLAQALLTRQQPLNLTLSPDPVLVKELGAAQCDASMPLAVNLIVRTLGAVELFPAVNCLSLKLKTLGRDLYGWRLLTCSWRPVFTAALAASFPSLTHLTLSGLKLTSMQLQQLVSHPALHQRLQHLDISDCSVACGKEPDSSSPFTGSRLQGLCLTAEQLHSLCPGPLDPKLTQLAVCEIGNKHTSDLAAAVRVQTSLQQLELRCEERCDDVKYEGMVLPELAHLPSLHTLLLIGYDVEQQALDELLALTQVTWLRVDGIGHLTESRASAACSWRKLEVDTMDWAAAARLPLHSLTHPLRLKDLGKGLKEGGDGSAALLNLWGRSEGAGVMVEEVCLNREGMDRLIEHCLEPTIDESSSSPCSDPCSSSSPSSSPCCDPCSSSSSPSSSPRGHPVAGVADHGPGGEEQQGRTTRRQALQGLKHNVIMVTIYVGSAPRLAKDQRRALKALFPTSIIRSQHMGMARRAWPGPAPPIPYHYY